MGYLKALLWTKDKKMQSAESFNSFSKKNTFENFEKFNLFLAHPLTLLALQAAGSGAGVVEDGPSAVYPRGSDT